MGCGLEINQPRCPGCVTDDAAGREAFGKLKPGDLFIGPDNQQHRVTARPAAPAQQPAAAPPKLDTMPSATGKDGKKLYWNGQSWINPDGSPYKP